MTKPYVPQVGHRVRATIEGVVMLAHGARVTIDLPGRTWEYTLPPGSTFTRLPDAEPDWQPGDIVIDAEGDVFLRNVTSNFPWLHGTEFHADVAPIRPLTRLVRETRP